MPARASSNTTCVALLRGINVGRAKRLPMAELRELLEELGYGDVRTLLNSGNAVFTAPRPVRARDRSGLVDQLERTIEARFGFESRVVLLTAAELAQVMAENPLAPEAHDHSRLLVALLGDPADAKRLHSLAKVDHGRERIAVGRRAAYVWCPDGILKSMLLDTIGRLLKGSVSTTRNWATMLKLDALVQSIDGRSH